MNPSSLFSNYNIPFMNAFPLLGIQPQSYSDIVYNVEQISSPLLRECLAPKMW